MNTSTLSPTKAKHLSAVIPPTPMDPQSIVRVSSCATTVTKTPPSTAVRWLDFPDSPSDSMRMQPSDSLRKQHSERVCKQLKGNFMNTSTLSPTKAKHLSAVIPPTPMRPLSTGRVSSCATTVTKTLTPIDPQSIVRVDSCATTVTKTPPSTAVRWLDFSDSPSDSVRMQPSESVCKQLVFDFNDENAPPSPTPDSVISTIAERALFAGRTNQRSTDDEKVSTIESQKKQIPVLAPYPITISKTTKPQIKIAGCMRSLNHLASGDRHDIYTFDIDRNDQSKIGGYFLNDLIVKILKEGHWKLHKTLMQNQSDQKAALEDKINVIPYLNSPDKDGFIISPFIKIPFPKQVLVSSSDEHKKLSKRDWQILADLKDMFTHGVKKNQIVDLKPDNLRIDDKGKLILIDLYEEKTGDELVSYINRSLRTFAEGNSYLRAYLIGDIKTVNKDVYEMIRTQ